MPCNWHAYSFPGGPIAELWLHYKVILTVHLPTGPGHLLEAPAQPYILKALSMKTSW